MLQQLLQQLIMTLRLSQCLVVVVVVYNSQPKCWDFSGSLPILPPMQCVSHLVLWAADDDRPTTLFNRHCMMQRIQKADAEEAR